MDDIEDLRTLAEEGNCGCGETAREVESEGEPEDAAALGPSRD